MAQQGKGRGARNGQKGRGGRGNAGADLQHPGFVLAQILEDTPAAVAAKWFGISANDLIAVLEGRAPMTAAMAQQAGAVFGTGSAPWLEMQAAWDEAHAPAAQKKSDEPQA